MLALNENPRNCRACATINFVRTLRCAPRALRTKQVRDVSPEQSQYLQMRSAGRGLCMQGGLMVAAELSVLALNENEAIIAEMMMRDAGTSVLLSQASLGRSRTCT